MGLIIATGLFICFNLTSRQEPVKPPITKPVESYAPKSGEDVVKATPTNSKIPVSTNDHDVFHLKRADLSQEQFDHFCGVFAERLKPAADRWGSAFEGHIPFNLDDLNTNTFWGQLGTEKNTIYTFMAGDVTVCLADENGSARLMYVNAPETKQLLQLPNGEAPMTKTSVSRTQIEQMVKAVSGLSFAPADIRITPTGYGSAMNGGTDVSIGGTPDNAASWKFNIVFDSNGKLIYYAHSK